MAIFSRTASGKCLRRRRRRTDGTCFGACAALLALLALTGASAAQEPGSPTESAGGIAAYESFISSVRALRARFAQELWSADNTLIEASSGTMALERPNRFHWRYETPFEQLLVADGARVWIYDVELEQVTVAPLDASHDASPALLLSGDEAVRDTFTVVASFALDGLQWVELAPKLAGADFSAVRLGFAGSAPREIELVDGLGQVTRIELIDPELEPSLPAELFRFEPPAGVDVIGADG